MRRALRILSRIAIVFGATLVAYLALLLNPQPLFGFEARAGNVVLHARTPLPPEGDRVAAAVRERIRESPLYDSAREYHAYLCDTQACFTLFALWRRRVGAIDQAELTGNAFLRPSNVTRDRLISFSGREPGGDRTLTYYVAHELTHAMTAACVGRLEFRRLEAWQTEGYADYVGKGGRGRMDIDDALERVRRGDPDFDPGGSGLYRRYHLLVALLLERDGMTVDELLRAPLDRSALEARLFGNEPTAPR